MKLDAVRAVEAAYSLVPDDAAWARGLLAALAPADPGLGLAALVRDVRDRGGRALRVLAEHGSLPEWQAPLQRLYAERERPGFPRMIGRPFAGLTSRWLATMDPRMRAAFQGVLDRSGVGGTFALVAPVEGCNFQVHLGIPRGRPPPPPGTRRQLACIGGHLVTAARLRRALAGAPPGAEDPLAEAVLDPGGRVLHLVPAARAPATRGRLVEAVRRLERARGALRWRSPDEALALWDGLIEGRWSLVDHLDADGRRLVIARRNPPGGDVRALAPHERAAVALALQGRSNKEIGFEMGLGASTVAGHLRSAQAKLGVASRRELIAALGSAAARERASGDA